MDLLADLQRETRHGPDPHHPRPRRGRRRRRPDRGHVRRAGSSSTAPVARHLHAARPTRTPRACSSSIPRRGPEGPGAATRSRACRRTSLRIPPGCAFHPRCPLTAQERLPRRDRCPPLREVVPGRTAAPATTARSVPLSGRRSAMAAATGTRSPALGEPILEVRGPGQALPADPGHPLQEADRRGPGRRRRRPSTCTAARRSASSASPAAASRRSPSCWWRWRSRPAARSSTRARTSPGCPARALKAVRRNIQIVFQDPYTSLNPRMTVGDIIGEPFEIHPEVAPEGRPARARSRSCSTSSASTPSTSTATRTSSPAVSASASASPAASRCSPEIIVCDEPVSALDVSVQAQVVNLLEDLQDEFGLSYIFIAHDLSVVRHISDRVAVMYLGKIVEIGTDDADLRARRRTPTRRRCCRRCRCPTRRLRERTRADHPAAATCRVPANPPSGCRFRTRCWKAQDICAERGAGARRPRAGPPGGLPLRRGPPGRRRHPLTPVARAGASSLRNRSPGSTRGRRGPCGRRRPTCGSCS